MASSCSRQSADAESGEHPSGGDTSSPSDEHNGRTPPPGSPGGDPDSKTQAVIDELTRKRNAAARLKSRYQNQLRGLTVLGQLPDVVAEAKTDKAPEETPSSKPPPPAAGEVVDGELANAPEAVFSAPVAQTVAVEVKRRADRSVVFPGVRGLHSAYDETKRIDLQLVLTEVTYAVETLTNLRTGESRRASMDDVGPRRSNLTWNTIATVILLVVGFAIPVNRVADMVAHKRLSSGRICTLLQWAARQLIPVVIFLGEELADCRYLAGDDSKTKVIDLGEAPKEDDPLAELDQRFGFTFARKDGKGDKASLNVSLLTGRLNEKDPRSTVHFFRTHIGNVGNLLSMILESRRPKTGPLTFQGDLSTGNLPSAEIRRLVKLVLAGCGAHARRPIWRYRDDDPQLCYYLLSCFFLLARIEVRIDALGRTRETTLRLRQRHARRVWDLIKSRCVAATQGGMTSAGPAIRWPPKTHLYDACMYIINHFDELTRYLSDPRLEWTNNARERGLRAEVYMLVSSKFRKTRRGRAALDVLRTINATCTAAGVPLADYLREVLPAGRKKIAENPAHYTPYAVAQRLSAARTAQAAASATPAA